MFNNNRDNDLMDDESTKM